MPKPCDCGLPATVQTLVIYNSGSIEVFWSCENHGRLLLRAAQRGGYKTESVLA